MTRTLKLECDYDPRVNFALQQNDVPVVKCLQIHNTGEDPVEDIEVRISADPVVFKPWTTRIAAIDDGSTLNLRNIPLSTGRLTCPNIKSQRGAGFPARLLGRTLGYGSQGGGGISPAVTSTSRSAVSLPPDAGRNVTWTR